jgi:AraC-like DNA-binding protein
MTGRLSFATDALAERDRFPAFCEEIVRRYTRLDLRTAEPARFRAAVDMQRIGAIGIGLLSTTALESSRTASLVRDGDDSILVTLVKSGQAYQEQRGYEQKLGAGDAIICDCGYPGELNFVTDSQLWHLKVPRQRITGLLLPRAAGYAGVRLDKDPTARRLLFDYLEATRDLGSDVGGRAGLIYEQHIIDLIALALGAGDEPQPAAEDCSIRALRRDAILRELNMLADDPNLSAKSIAGRLGITPRYLRMLLEETGRSFSEHLLAKRLERAAALLREERWQRRRIADIAFACGFGDLSYFNRSFRRHYGATPSDVRESAKEAAKSS